MFRKILWLLSIVLVFSSATEAINPATAQPVILQIVPQEFKKTTNAYKIEMVYPKIEGMKDANIQQLINRQVNKTIEKNRSKFLKENTRPFGQFKNTMSLRYEVIGLTSSYLSIKIKTEVIYAGAPHPQSWLDSLNFDLKSGQNLALSQIFRPNSDFLKIIADYCTKELLSRPELSRDEEWVRKGTEPLLTNYKIFNLGNNSLLITFSEYQVGPYVVGEPVVEISFDKLKSTIKYGF